MLISGENCNVSLKKTHDKQKEAAEGPFLINKPLQRDTYYQRDQMARLFYQYFAISGNE